MVQHEDKGSNPHLSCNCPVGMVPAGDCSIKETEAEDSQSKVAS